MPFPNRETPQQLGRAFTIICMQRAKEIVAHADVSAWGAPSECHTLVAQGEEERYQAACREAQKVSGLDEDTFISMCKTHDRYFNATKHGDRFLEACLVATGYPLEML